MSNTKIFAQIFSPKGDVFWTGWALTEEDAWVASRKRNNFLDTTTTTDMQNLGYKLSIIETKEHHRHAM